ncbi:hypothetical protein AGLY_003746 [Aphis glycines]|uniref:Uncharacterized protein n=1 Tax=Aphis glycines TaxID=307491 RepID=A0A6G0TZH3_APHGL|nr:hypothetical protein AGLY_003746 [Aphis glycines]
MKNSKKITKKKCSSSTSKQLTETDKYLNRNTIERQFEFLSFTLETFVETKSENTAVNMGDLIGSDNSFLKPRCFKFAFIIRDGYLCYRNCTAIIDRQQRRQCLQTSQGRVTTHLNLRFSVRPLLVFLLTVFLSSPLLPRSDQFSDERFLFTESLELSVNLSISRFITIYSGKQQQH